MVLLTSHVQVIRAHELTSESWDSKLEEGCNPLQMGWKVKKNTLLVLVSILGLSIINSHGQKGRKGTVEDVNGVTVIKNPKRPLSDAAGRLIFLEEILRIKDDGVNFYFKLPWGIDVDNTGSIYVQDGVRLFKFSSEGTYEGNIIKNGQGPGEISGITHFSFDNGEIIIFCASMSKLLKLNSDGTLIKEKILDKKRLTGCLGYFKNSIFLFDFLPRNPEETQGILEYNRNLYVVDEKGNFNKTEYSFPVKIFRNVRSYAGRTAVSSYGVTGIKKSSIIQRYVYLSHTQEYQIIQFDLEDQKMSKIFMRDFPRVKCPPNKKGPLQSIKYHNDIHRLLVHGNNVWVLTSIFDNNKGILVDVFNHEGIYVDSFYMPLLNSNTNESFAQLYFPLRIKDNHIYAIEHDEDWAFSIAKYKIIDSY